ncbi:MAG: ABC transporter substrate-binding protein [Thermoplasmataceae archaeon]
MDSNKPNEGGAGLGPAPPVKPSGNAKWYAVIVVLIIVIAALGVLYATKAPPTPVGTSASIAGPQATSAVGNPYSFYVNTTSSFKNITVWFGDGTTQLINYSGSNSVKVTHTYQSQGQYFIYYVVNYGSSTSNGLIPLDVGFGAAINANLSYGFAQLIANSTAPVSTNPIVFGPGASLTYQISYSTPSNVSMQVINLTVNIWQGNNLIQQHFYPLVYSPSQGGFVLPQGIIQTYLSNLPSGYYTMQIYVTTGSLETNTIQIPIVFSNTTLHSYTAGQTVYYNQTSYKLGSSVVNFTPILEFMKGVSVTNYKGTNVTYLSATNATYGSKVSLSFPAMSVLTLPMGANITYLTDTNISVASNTHVNYAGGSNKVLSAGKTSFMKAGNYTDFLNATTVTLLNASKIQLSTSWVNYTASQSLTYDESMQTTYNSDVTNLTLTNVTNYLTYETNAKVNVTNKIQTTATQTVNTGGAIVNATADTTVSYLDVPIFSKVTPYTSSALTTFVNGEDNAPGGYTTLDPAISFYTASNEILTNTLMQLDQYNGTSTTSFIPELAAYLPTASNGGINTNWDNFTANTENATGAPITFKVTVAPYENYTFHIRSNVKDQFGNSITAYDVYYEIIRDMLFIDASPGTGGYLIGSYFANALSPAFIASPYQYLMPNLTYNNHTDNFTIHFQQPMPPDLVYQLFAASGTYVESAKWLSQHGAGITFTPQGFISYEAQGNLGDYNTYVQNHVAADGPYEISLISPAQFVVLTANPNFVAPNKYYPAPTVKTVILQYLNSPNTAYLELKSGVATTAAIPTTMWNDVLALEKQGVVTISGFPTLGIYFYNFNININETMLHTIDSAANLPPNFFLNPNVREAFSYAYNYTYYYEQQVGNAIYNTTFLAPYAGMIVPGLPFAQNITDLQKAGVNVPYTDLAKARMYWSYFMNGSASDNASSMGITNPTSPTYNGNSLRVPIFIPQNDPVDSAGVTTWGQMLAQVIPGIKVDVIPTTLTNIFQVYAVPGQNPMPVSWGGWSPDYPYPTDYLSAMFLPVPTSTYQNANSYNVSFVAGHATHRYGKALVNNTTEAAIFQQIINAYNNGTAHETNNTLAAYWFQKMNEMSVNMSFEVYIGQSYLQWVMNSAVNKTGIEMWQENVMVGGGQELMYNYITFNPSAKT